MADDKKNGIFRKAALDRLSSPEALDVLSQVITPRAWLLLLPLLVLTVFAVVWAFAGRLPDKLASPNCILLNASGLSRVVATSTGRLLSLDVKVGDTVQVGDAVGRLALPELDDAATRLTARIAELKARRDVIEKFGSDSDALGDKTVEQQRALLQGQIASMRNRIASARERVQSLEDRVKIQEELYQRGLVTQIAVLGTRQDLAATRQDEESLKLQLESYQGQFDQLKLGRLEKRRSNSAQREEITAQIGEQERELFSLKSRIAEQSVIRSSHSGKVVELAQAAGTLIGPGATVVTLELDNSAAMPLEAVVFPGLSAGRKVAAGMPVQVVPSTVKRQEFGFITGKVTRVADYPSTQQGLMRILQNEMLANTLAAREPPLAVHVALDTASTPSGFQWSASDGPRQALRSGTLCAADIVVNTQRPIELVVPALRKVLMP